jgi:ribosomal protein L19E
MTNLRTKKALASKALKVGKGKLIFSEEGMSEIKEAITRQDIKDLASQGIITIKPIKGRKKIVRRKTRRGPGKIKKTVNHRKQEYVKITRKLRNYLMELRDRGIVERDLYWTLRNKIRMRDFKSKANFKDYLRGIEIKVDSASSIGKPSVKKAKVEEKTEVKKVNGKEEKK